MKIKQPVTTVPCWGSWGAEEKISNRFVMKVSKLRSMWLRHEEKKTRKWIMTCADLLMMMVYNEIEQG